VESKIRLCSNTEHPEDISKTIKGFNHKTTQIIMKTAQTKLMDAVVMKLQDLYGTTYAGLAAVTDMFFTLRNQGINEVKRAGLTEPELRAVADALNGISLDADMLCSTNALVALMLDAEDLSSIITNQSADAKILIAKLKTFNSLQTFFLQHEIRLLWSSPASFDDWKKVFLM